MTEAAFLRSTRASYDAFAVEYAERFQDEIAAKPLERGMLASFAELVGTGPVADVGCGTGRVSAHLKGMGLDVFGVDLSPGMIAVARRTHPGIRFEVGSMLDLEIEDGSLAGLLAWYSTIHVPDERLGAVFAEFHRVLAPGGHVLLGFQVGDEPQRRTEVWGHAIELDFHRRRPERVAASLAEAGLETRARMVKERDEDGEFAERTPQGFVLARRPRG